MFIMRAAIMYPNDEIIEGYSYSNIVSVANKLSLNGENVHGFVTGAGIFVTPQEAAKIALGSKQIEEEVEELSPEMLWPNYLYDL